MDSNALQIFGIEENSFVDGPGMRFAIFLQGCPHHCPGCHNPESQHIGSEFGIIMSIDQLVSRIETVAPYISGITLSGGEPFLQADSCVVLMRKIREKFPQFENWIWSGWTYEELLNDPNKTELLNLMDVLVDGPFIQKDRTLSLPWRGSPNQRVIDLVSSRNIGELKLKEN